MSKATELQEARKRSGIIAVNKNFEYIPTDQSIDDYYNSILSDDDINAAVLAYEKEIDDIHTEFSKRTGLKKTDMLFLVFATALQCLRQYCLTDFKERLDDQEAANKIKKDKEHSNRIHTLYNPSLEEIITNPVPFDANIGANGALAGGGKLGHRATAIGHDPILGLLFGTCNIATSTLTTWSMQSYHIKTGVLNKDVFDRKADTSKVLNKTFDKLVHGDISQKSIVGMSLLKEIKHLKSDIYSTNSLPLPFISAISPQLASELATYGLDMANVLTVGKQATLAIAINAIIAMIHKLLFTKDPEPDERLYRARTKKIILYSNVLATSSNILYTCFSGNYKKLDIGGALVTLSRIFFDTRFIEKLKYEFLNEELAKKYNEEYAKIEKYYSI